MISLESKTQTSTPSSPLNLAPQEESTQATLSFSQLLRGASAKQDDKVIQNGVLVLDLGEETPKDGKAISSKVDSLLELLKGDKSVKGEKSEETKLPLALNPEITKNLSPAELKVLVKDAKEYLKSKIIESEGFKKVEIQSLPKTLKGLVQVAKKFNIDVSKISLEEVRSNIVVASTNPITKVLGSLGVQKTDTIESKTKIKPQIQSQVQETDTIESKTKIKPQIQSQVQEIPEIDLQTLLKKTPKEVLSILKEVKPDVKSEIKATPLFKAQVSKEITTEQLVNVKINTLESNVPKKKEDETLKLLLRGKNITKKDKGFTADFSVATAKVIAPSATTDISKNLESLLKGETKESTTVQKIDGLNVAKADSFEIKLHEAKQMTKYISQDVKTAIEDYKSPFTRIKVALNPQRLGSVELTVVQRGKNLHISLSSNNAAINALALNANDLKVQLTNNGINNATLNFNNNSESSGQSSFGQQQQNSQRREEAAEKYTSLQELQNEEQNEEIIQSLEIVVPHYA